MFDFLSQKFSGVLSWISGKSKLTEANIDDALLQVKEALLQADVPYNVVKDFLDQVSQDVVGLKADTRLDPGKHFIKVVNEKLISFLGGSDRVEKPSFLFPSVIMVMGLQGSGKTTTVAKLVRWVKSEAQKRGKERRILVASVDYYRPAAIEQLGVLANKVSVDFYKSSCSDSVSAARDIYNYFKKNNYELLFLDTAGRLHIDEALMSELKKIFDIVSPRGTYLVLDSMTGQESLNVAKEFEKTIGFQSAILTKMDSDTRGGAAFAFCYALKKPIYFIGTGEKIDDLELFIPKRVASRILGMGDMLSLIEQASEKVDVHTQESLAKKMMSGDFSLDDFAEQLSMVGKMGSMQKILKYIPGAGTVSPEMIEKSEKEVVVFKAILSSMTKKERMFPQLLGASRKKRIAKGSGTNLQNINQLLQKFEQSKQFAKMFKKMGKLPFFK